MDYYTLFLFSFRIPNDGDEDLAASSSRFDKTVDQVVDFERAYGNRDALTLGDRFGLMWRFDDYGNPSPELSFVKNSTFLAFLTGLVWGGYSDSKETRKKFMVENKHEMFKHPFEAQAAMVDRMGISFMKGGWRYTTDCTRISNPWSCAEL